MSPPKSRRPSFDSALESIPLTLLMEKAARGVHPRPADECAGLEAATQRRRNGVTTCRWRRNRRFFTVFLSFVLFCLTIAVLYASSSDVIGFSTSLLHAPNASHQPPSFSPENDFLLHPENHIYREARTIHLSWNVTKATRSPDGVLKPVYLINGQFPGPLIEARSGDELVVNVRNAMYASANDSAVSEGIAVHWHGLAMKDANDMDGAVGLTQCAINPGEEFTYRFRIDPEQSGTFWYHAHAGVQRADGLYGGLVIHKPVTEGGKRSSDKSIHGYDAEQLLLVGDWYHRPAEAVLEWFMDPNHYAYEPAPDSMLINGRGHYNCSMAVKANPVNCSLVEDPVLKFSANRVLLRIVNTGITAGLTLALGQGTMKLVAVDGGSPVSNTSATAAIGVLYPGERMDVIVDRGSSTIVDENRNTTAELRIALDRENMNLINFGLKRKQAFPLVWAPEQEDVPQGSEDVTAHVDLRKISGSPLDSSLSSLIEHPEETAVLYTTMLVRAANHNRPVGTVNHTSWAVADPKSRPLLSLDREKWSSAVPQPTSAQRFKVPWFRQSGQSKWFELVINNFDDRGHPFHLHGYSFYVVASRGAQAGEPVGFNPLDKTAAAKAPPVNIVNPLRKDTVHVPAQGYVVLRFPLDNDGLWLLHCHVLWHQAAGMGIVLQVGDIPTEAAERASALCTR